MDIVAFYQDSNENPDDHAFQKVWSQQNKSDSSGSENFENTPPATPSSESRSPQRVSTTSLDKVVESHQETPKQGRVSPSQTRGQSQTPQQVTPKVHQENQFIPSRPAPKPPSTPGSSQSINRTPTLQKQGLDYTPRQARTSPPNQTKSPAHLEKKLNHKNQSNH